MIARLFRNIVSGLALLLVLAGLPAGLVVVQRAAQWDWRQLVADPLSGGGAVMAGVAAGWLLWLALLWMVVLDAVDAIRQVGRAPRLPVPLHAAVTALVSGILLAVEATRGGGAGGPADHHARTSSVAATPPAAEDVRDAKATVQDADEHVASHSVLTVMGVEVPGGWLPVPVTAAVTAAATLMWAQRRHRYLPQPPAGWRRDDEDLAPLPALVDRIARLTRAAMEADADRAAMTSGDDDGPVPDAATVWPVEAILPAAGVALVGPGAVDAARGLLAAVTIGHTVHAEVLVGEGLWKRLLGADAVAGVSGRVRVVADDAPSPVASAPNESDAATIVVLADAATTNAPPLVERPAAGDGVTVRTVVIGAAAGVHTWHVASDGRLHAAAGPAPVVGRLPVLNLPTARTLLGALDVVAAVVGNLDAPASGSTAPPERHHLHRTVPASWSAHTSTDRPVSRHADAQLPSWPDPPPDEPGRPRRLLVRVLGVPAVLLPHPDGSHSTVQIRRSAGQQILVLLIIHRAGLSAAELKEAIWPDTPGKAAHRRFVTTVSELRRALHDAAKRPVLLQRRQSDDPAGAWYRLDTSTVQVDLWQLQALLDAAVATIDPIHRDQLLTEAADLYRTDLSGELAQGWDHEWLAAAREHVARHQIDVLTCLADVEPDPATAIQLLRQAKQVSPTNEAVHRRLMALHAAADDSTAMRRAAATLAEHLAEHHLTQDPTTVHPSDTPRPAQAAPYGPSASTRN
ncbi:bacterial transcriptional activator domain-containing protein [Dactylosporangium sp. NPDC049525]|uniref:bacterial transcriptional activator domain-containing protein n=1 Tax=Dactylosporangium sp. NPDC049525 TaxID=3154730 RepID=UPI00341C7743